MSDGLGTGWAIPALTLLDVAGWALTLALPGYAVLRGLIEAVQSIQRSRRK